MMESGKKMMERDLKAVDDVNRQKDKEIDELFAENAAEKLHIDAY